jgi:hypothetical protein
MGDAGIVDLDQDSDGDAPGTQAKGAGRPPAPVRRFFEATGGKDTSSKRGGCQCLHCGVKFTRSQSRVQTLEQHILHQCTKVPADFREEFQSECTKGLPLASAPTVSRSGTKGGKQQLTMQQTFAASKPFPADLQERMNIKLLRWMVTSAVPFNAVESPFFLDYIGDISGGRARPAGEST